MKKTIALFTLLILLILSGCNKPAAEDISSEAPSSSETSTSASHGTAILDPDDMPTGEVTTVDSLGVEELDPASVYVVYFSHSNDPVDVIASYINDETGGEIHKVETLEVYPEDERELVKRAQQQYNERGTNWPALKNSPQSMSGYDFIFLCFPAWAESMPIPLWTFINDYDMSGKYIVPICYGSEKALENAIRDINFVDPALFVTKGYCFSDDFLAEQAEFDKWMNSLIYG